MGLVPLFNMVIFPALYIKMPFLIFWRHSLHVLLALDKYGLH